jgi:hypothetical protein
MMDDFDEECPRCHGQGIATPPAVVPPQPAPQSTPVAPPPVSTPASQIKFADAAAYERLCGLCGIGFLGGLAIAIYFFFFFDTSVAVPSVSFMGEEFGGGRVNNIGLMAQRQNGILFGFGTSIVSAIVYFLLQNQIRQGE